MIPSSLEKRQVSAIYRNLIHFHMLPNFLFLGPQVDIPTCCTLSREGFIFQVSTGIHGTHGTLRTMEGIWWLEASSKKIKSSVTKGVTKSTLELCISTVLDKKN